MRLAEANAMIGVSEICKRFSAKYSTLMTLREDILQRLVSGLPVTLPPPKTRIEEVEDRCYRPWLGAWSRVCPFCLDEELFVPEKFTFSLALICEVHQVHLIDHCPSCRRRLLYTRRRRGLCNCGFDLRHSPRIATEVWVTQLYNVFAPWRLGGAERSIYDQRFCERLSGIALRVLFGLRYPNYEDRISSTDKEAILSLLGESPDGLEKQLARRVRHLTYTKYARIADCLRNVELPVLRRAVNLAYPESLPFLSKPLQSKIENKTLFSKEWWSRDCKQIEAMAERATGNVPNTTKTV